ncbi:Phosphoglycerate kinase [Geodia barretti]|uniref:Phosphoglycerate kinase n=2 Tax=Geodia barretti TaxID=519541 RepID=A0AA35XFF9_GEOBA|nr:Phosphoglycerate kinase [Geodia barretti]
MRPGTTEILDDRRILATVPTLAHLVERLCRVLIVTHLGRPNGHRIMDLSLAPVSSRVLQLPGHKGLHLKVAIDAMTPGSIAMLENIRFDPGEAANDPALAEDLAALADVFVNDAFGAAHRAHASTEGVAHHLPALAGLLMEKELVALGGALQTPERPFTAIVGGAKVSDKIAMLDRLVSLVDTLIIGGGMAATFLAAQGHRVGASILEEDRMEYARGLLSGAHRGSAQVLAPTDVVVANAFSENAKTKLVSVDDIPDDWLVLDIGPRTADAYCRAVSASRTVLWNGPMGVFEWETFSGGTRKVAEAIADLHGTATTVTGGGSTSEAVSRLGLTSRISHDSTGGGATLAFIEGKVLPGVAALMDE